MDNQMLEYRKIHGVVPQLDFVNYQHPLQMVPQTPVVYSRFASLSNPITPKAGKIASGVGNVFMGALHLASGNTGYGIGKMAAGAINAGAGVVDPASLGVNQSIAKQIQECEEIAWNELNFLRNFQPASGNLGEFIFKDGSCDELHCGNGHKFFDNGDYFEGFWDDGRIKIGLYVWNSGARYLGEFQNGNRVGLGTMIYDGGEYYRGESMNNVRHGYGAMWYLDGVYIGDWINNNRHGEGFCKFNDNSFFEGEWYNDQPVR